MRLAGLAVLALALVGTLVLLGQNGAFDDVWERATGERVQRVTSPDKTVLTSLDIEGTSVFGAPTVQDSQVILSGFPSYAGLKFDLPVDARPLSGTLNLDFTSLVAEDVEGALRVSVNGQKRADFLLLQGDKKNALQIELTGADLSSGTISVGLSLQGRGPIAQCSVDDAIAAVVNFDGSSGLRLELDNTVETSRDRLALWGNRVPVNWPPNAPESAYSGADFLHQAAVLESKGYKTVFTPNGVNLEELRTIAAEAQNNSSNTVPDAYPISLISNPANEGIKTFTRRAAWRYSYNADELPEGRLPAALNLRMKVGPSSDDARRDVTVTINDMLLLSRRIDSDVEQLNQSIAIPAVAQRQSNNLEIGVTAYNPGGTQCGDIPQSVAELLSDTVLIDGASQVAGPIESIISLLVSEGSAAIDDNGITASEASVASSLLAALKPATWEASADASGAQIKILRNGALINQSQLSAESSHWLIYSGPQHGNEIKIQQLNPTISGGQNSASGVALLVTVKNAGPFPASSQLTNRLSRIIENKS